MKKKKITIGPPGTGVVPALLRGREGPRGGRPAQAPWPGRGREAALAKGDSSTTGVGWPRASSLLPALAGAAAAAAATGPAACGAAAGDGRSHACSEGTRPDSCPAMGEPAASWPAGWQAGDACPCWLHPSGVQLTDGPSTANPALTAACCSSPCTLVLKKPNTCGSSRGGSGGARSSGSMSAAKSVWHTPALGQRSAKPQSQSEVAAPGLT